MRRLPGTLALALGLALAGCGPDAVVRADGDPHAGLACADCHEGGLADAGEATVPPEACTGSWGMG